MSQTFMNTKEVAEYLDIHEKQVYALVKAGRIPRPRPRESGYSKALIDEWIERLAKEGLRRPDRRSGRIAGALLAAGSNDPILDVFCQRCNHTHPEFHIFRRAWARRQA